MHGPDALLRQVIEHPDWDGPRLIYADWLGERYDPRGEFIRLQCAFAQLPAGDERRNELQERSDELLKVHQDEWVGPLRSLVSGWRFQRGFIDTIYIDARRFLAHADQVFQLAPVRHMHLLDVGRRVAEVAASPVLVRLAGLTLFASHVGDSVARSLAHSAHLTGLTELNLGRNRITDDGAVALAGSPCLSQLTSLDLSENEIGTAGANAIAASLPAWESCR